MQQVSITHNKVLSKGQQEEQENGNKFANCDCKPTVVLLQMQGKHYIQCKVFTNLCLFICKI